MLLRAHAATTDSLISACVSHAFNRWDRQQNPALFMNGSMVISDSASGAPRARRTHPTRRSAAARRERNGSDDPRSAHMSISAAGCDCRRPPARTGRSLRGTLNCLADWHHSGHPGNRDGEGEKAEHQAGRSAEHCQRAGVLSAESHARESSSSDVVPLLARRFVQICDETDKTAPIKRLQAGFQIGPSLAPR